MFSSISAILLNIARFKIMACDMIPSSAACLCLNAIFPFIGINLMPKGKAAISHIGKGGVAKHHASHKSEIRLFLAIKSLCSGH